jgi:hypothetical protein
MKSGVRLIGMDNVRRALEAAKGLTTRYTLLRRLDLHWGQAALAIQSLAQDKAPVDEGTLEASAVSRSGFEGISLTAQIEFGGLASTYASVQHEGDDFVHPKKGQAHFLYGAPTSAWEQSEATILRQLDHEIGWIAEDVIGGA